MSEPVRGARLHHSVFVKLVAVMMTMTVVLIAMVSAFIGLLLQPNLALSERLIEGYAQVLAKTAPDRDTAKRLGDPLEVETRYEGPHVAWATDDHLPRIEEVRRGRSGDGWRRSVGGRDYYLVSDAKGGTYLFSWDYRQQVLDAHYTLLWLLFGSMIATVLVAYVVIRRLLRPLRVLGDGVSRLSDGELDVVLPNRTRDEFGSLTEGFNQMVRRVGEMIRARDRLLLDVSHELRSPLTRMKVALALVPEGDDRARMAADVAEMEVMVAELLELERLRDGRGIRTTRQDLIPLVREVAERFRDRAPGVRIVSTVRSVVVDMDEDRIRIALRNLLENAVKYSLPDSRAVELAVVPSDASVAIRVSDDGPGIPEGDMAQLFEPFFRVDRSRSRKTGGYGLGLSITKRVMDAHGGSVAVENRSPRGARFTLTLPKPAA
jgi:signal transduction histidine kinase